MVAAEEPAAATLFACRACGPLPRTAFHASCVARFIHRCIQCTQAKNRKYFQSAKYTTVQDWRVRRRASGKLDRISRKELATIFEVHGRRCFVTSLPGPLTLIRADPDREFIAANAVPVLSKLASSLPHLPIDALNRWRSMRTARPTPTQPSIDEELPFPVASPPPELAMVAAESGGVHTDEWVGANERPTRADGGGGDLLLCGTEDHDETTTSCEKEEAKASDHAGRLFVPRTCGSDDLDRGAAVGRVHVSVSKGPASLSDSAEMMEAGRARLRMLVALKKRNASVAMS